MTSPAAVPQLAELQRQFQSYLLRRTDRHPGVIVDPAGAAVYAEAYLLRLGAALATDYPALRTLLGADGFETLARDYALVQPSQHYSVRWFGRRLPDYLRTAAPFAAEPYLAELATVEWLIGEAFDAADAGTLDAASLRQVPAEDWGALAFGFHPTLRRLELRFDAFDLRRTLGEHGRCAEIPRPGESTPWIVWRQGLDVRYRRLEPAEAAALDALRGGASLGEASLPLVEKHAMPVEQAPACLARWISIWIDLGLLTSAGPACQR